MSSSPLLGPGDPPCYRVAREAGRSPFVLTCDHAGRALPRSLGDLGLTPGALETHVAWDLGIAALGEQLAHALDAFLILQTYARLVIDANRPLDAPEARLRRATERAARARATRHSARRARASPRFDRKRGRSARHGSTPRALSSRRRFRVVSGVITRRIPCARAATRAKGASVTSG